MKRKWQHERFIRTFVKILPSVSENISAIAEATERAVDIQEEVAKAQIKRNDAVTELIKNLSGFLSSDKPQRKINKIEPGAEISYA